MKRFTLSLLLLIGTLSITNAQIVNTPDTNFKAALIAHNPVIDTDSDGEIQISEAVAFSDTIDVHSENISDLTGIEEFINITGLDCSSNHLTNIDMSNNLNLTYLNCSNNDSTILNVSNNTNLIKLICYGISLEYLDIGNNINLEHLKCAFNNLTNLDVSNNIKLDTLDCYVNIISNLDVSNLSMLKYLDCQGNILTNINITNSVNLTYLNCTNNQLDSIDLTNNINLTTLILGDVISMPSNYFESLNISNNVLLETIWLTAIPTLSEVCVWELPFPTSNVNIYTDGSPNVFYTTSCLSNIAETNNSIANFNIYPNPTTGNVQITMSNEQLGSTVQIINVSGEVVKQLVINKEQLTIDLSAEAKGIYFVKLTTANGVTTQKLILE